MRFLGRQNLQSLVTGFDCPVLLAVGDRRGTFPSEQTDVVPLLPGSHVGKGLMTDMKSPKEVEGERTNRTDTDVFVSNSGTDLRLAFLVCFAFEQVQNNRLAFGRAFLFHFVQVKIGQHGVPLVL